MPTPQQPLWIHTAIQRALLYGKSRGRLGGGELRRPYSVERHISDPLRVGLPMHHQIVPPTVAAHLQQAARSHGLRAAVIGGPLRSEARRVGEESGARVW